ncbi:hypothetical protein E4T66_10230 [Sinimarinibacterium sp. CAU 1509]|nr:hypothetical protein E4T66_10230 [Sinimarinibacterium sp. CAU 1509]
MDAMFLHLESPSMRAHVAGRQIFSVPRGASSDFVQELVAELRRPRELSQP